MAESDYIQKKTGNNKGPKFLLLGKYFLIILVFAAQGFLAYTIVDKNYAQIYSLISSYTPDSFGIYQFDELIVNPSGTNGKRYLLVEISVKLQDEKHVELVARNKERIKHNMNEALSSRTVDELIDFEKRELLRRELAEIVNSAIEIRSVRNLYYNKYVMQ